MHFPKLTRENLVEKPEEMWKEREKERFLVENDEGKGAEKTMKKKTIQMLVCGMTAMALVLGGVSVAPANAAETETTQTESAETTAGEEHTETETASTEENSETETEKAADVEVTEGDKALWTLDNQSGVSFEKAVLTEKELVLTDEKGESHTIQDVDKEDIEENTLALVKYGSFLALQYDSKEQNASKRLVEEGEELLFAEAKPMYVLDDVYVRAQPEFDAEPVSVAGRGSEIQVTGEFPKWYQMKLEDGEGFISKSYVTAKKEEAEQAAAADAQARAAKAAAEQQVAEQAAQEAAAWTDQAAAGDASWSGGNAAEAAPQERVEVSRQAYDDCDGSGHGYFEITYSDGTVEIQEY